MRNYPRVVHWEVVLFGLDGTMVESSLLVRHNHEEGRVEWQLYIDLRWWDRDSVSVGLVRWRHHPTQSALITRGVKLNGLERWF